MAKRQYDFWEKIELLFRGSCRPKKPSKNNGISAQDNAIDGVDVKTSSDDRPSKSLSASHSIGIICGQAGRLILSGSFVALVLTSKLALELRALVILFGLKAVRGVQLACVWGIRYLNALNPMARRATYAALGLLVCGLVFAIYDASSSPKYRPPLGARKYDPTDVHVRSYSRNDGTPVTEHFRTYPDGDTRNNYSTYPNVNPYTGETGSNRVDDTASQLPTLPTLKSRFTELKPSEFKSRFTEMKPSEFKKLRGLNDPE